MLSKPPSSAQFIFSDRYRKHSYGANHPLGIPRVSLTYDLIQAFNAITDSEVINSRQASIDELIAFHTPEYLQAMQKSEDQNKITDSYRKKHNIGNFENPYFPGFFTTPATATGGSIQAAEAVLKGNIGFSPAGGMHHSMPDRANGFCFLNDPVMAINHLLNAGLSVLYVDIDAHHGDGVEFAYRHNPEVSTFSLHMDTGYAYPFKGGEIECTGEYSNAINLPLPKKTNDSEYEWAFSKVWEKILSHVEFDAVVLQAGTDILNPDPLGKFQISTQQFLKTVETIKSSIPSSENAVSRLAVLGGGGYHPLSLSRCWLGVWAILSNRQLPEQLPQAAIELLRNIDWDMDEDEDYYPKFFQTRLDDAYRNGIRDEIKIRVEHLLKIHPRLNG